MAMLHLHQTIAASFLDHHSMYQAHVLRCHVRSFGYDEAVHGCLMLKAEDVAWAMTYRDIHKSVAKLFLARGTN
jgi:hypothetical protein